MTTTQLPSTDFKEFLEAHVGIVTKVCRVYTDTEEDFEDFFQEVSLQLWRSWGSFRGEAKRSTWVYRVALNVCLLQLRGQKRRPAWQALDPERVHLADDGSGNEREYQIQRLYHAIRQLKESERALMLLYLEDKSYKEMAEILGITITHVGVKVNRAKGKLKELLGEEIEE